LEGKFQMNRRELLTGASLGASAGVAGVLAPIKALGAEVRPIRIKHVETFNIEIPATPTEVEAGVTNRTAVVRVETESGVRGYSFGAAGGGGGRGGVGAPLEDLALATPPLLPQEQWAPALKILKSKELSTFKNGEIQVPQGPGLGLDINEETLERYKV
jgi:L-alanine-DL-glutamate epimerase-like enolase superfamily enzyme